MSKNRKGQDFDRINGSQDLQEARANISWQEKRIASLTIVNTQLKAQITSLKNELADVYEDQEGMKNLLDDGYKNTEDDDGGENQL